MTQGLRARGQRIREVARLAGERYYESGVQCRNKHNGRRYTSTGQCVNCVRLAPSATGSAPPNRPAPEGCEICGAAPSNKRQELCLDHCHLTGRFRGWLCVKCNMGIGSFGDTKALLYKALDYLAMSETWDDSYKN